MVRKPLSAGDVRVVPATVERTDDACAAVSPGCWCMIPRFPSSQLPDGREAKLRELCAGDEPPGLIAYAGDEVAGWVGFGPLDKLPSVRGSRRLTQVDDLPFWTIVCFRVRRKFQGRGLARMLLDAAVEYVREAGAPGIQAYPADPPGGRMNSTNAYVGVTSMFEEAGFERVVKTPSTSGNHPRWLMRRWFSQTAPAARP